MADPTFDQISASTLSDMRDDVVYDEFFVEGALQRKFRASGALDEYLGGTIMQTPFVYGRVAGGAHAPGADVVIDQRPILAATGFVPKEYIEQVPLNLWQTNVINSGPAAKVKLTDLYMTVAVQSLNTDLGIDIFRHGQAAATGVSDGRALFINGISEALNDGVTNGWDGNYFTYYGGQIRNGAIGNVLNSIPYFCGKADGSVGPISYKIVLESILDCVKAPDTGITNKALWAYLAERQEPKQNFVQEKDMSIGVTGLKILDTYIHMDKLCPSTKYGQILPSGLSQTTAVQPSTFTSVASGASSISNLPASQTIYPGEILFLLRVQDWKVRPAVDEEYNFNFTPPIRSQQNPDLIVMFLKAGINFYTPSPRDNKQIYGAGF